MMVERDVSRETKVALEQFCADVKKWNPAINLVSKSTIANIWDRHILDSLQIANFAPKSGLWLDVGSGGGFPGLVVAIWAKEHRPNLSFALVESDARKSAFLRHTAGIHALNAEILTERVENIKPIGADVFSARALAPLENLLQMSETHLSNSGTCVFPKGRLFREEVEKAKKQWSFDCDVIESVTSSDAAILRITNASRKP